MGNRQIHPSFCPQAPKHQLPLSYCFDICLNQEVSFLWTSELEQLRMLQGAAHERAKPDWIWNNLRNPAAVVANLHVEGDEVKLVDVLPLIESGVDFAGESGHQFLKVNFMR